MSVLVSLLPSLFKIIGWIISRGKVTKEQKELFLRFYEQYEGLGNSSVAQHDDVSNQLNDLNKEK